MTDQQVAKPQNTTAATPTKKTSPWVWVGMGCLIIVLITVAASGFLIWWSAKKLKNELEQHKPNIEQTSEKLKQLNAEADKWQKAAEEISKNIPDSTLPEDNSNNE
jgi:flagellar basal body-associated protein FliL